jgi:4,5-DOPA dioxygenase extradiol
MTELNFLSSFSDTDQMPLLFTGHGNPMNAIEENHFVKGFRNIAQTLPKPNAVLCISAHWFTNGTKVTAMEKPKTIHDFYGFPPELYAVTYPAEGCPELAKASKQLLSPTPVELDEKWGLDHGAWSVIKRLYPHADTPVVQLSIDYTKPAEYHFNLAKQLSALRNKGVLIIGSGNIIHNLRLVDFKNFDKKNYGYDWAIEAHEKINSLIENENFAPLLNYEKLGTAVNLAVPTPDHYLPLMYVLGLKQKHETIGFFNDELVAGSLSMTSIKISLKEK